MIRYILIVTSLLLGGCTAARVLTHGASPAPIDAPAGRYALDGEHASLIFDVEHLKFSRFAGRFNSITATLDFIPAAPAQSHVSASIAAASLDTQVEKLDELIKGPDMLDVTRYPEIRFESSEIIAVAPAQGQVTGKLSLHGVTRPITLNVSYNGGAKNPLTQKHTLGFSASGVFLRSNFGLGAWFPAVGDEVRVRIEAEFVLQDGAQ